MIRRYEFIRSEEGNHSIRNMCIWAQVSRSGGRPDRYLLRQCVGGIIQCDVEGGAGAPDGVFDPGESDHRRDTLDRITLQSETTPLQARIPNSERSRTSLVHHPPNSLKPTIKPVRNQPRTPDLSKAIAEDGLVKCSSRAMVRDRTAGRKHDRRSARRCEPPVSHLIARAHGRPWRSHSPVRDEARLERADAAAISVERIYSAEFTPAELDVLRDLLTRAEQCLN